MAINIMVSTFLFGCSPKPVSSTSYHPGFLYLAVATKQNNISNNIYSLVLSERPGGEPLSSIPVKPPTDCSLFAIRPAPSGRWIAVEWECSFGPTVELFDAAGGASHFVLSDPTIDSRFLAWQPDGKALYLKIGTLSIPQTLRVEAATGKASELPISPFAYDLTTTPDGKKVLYSLSKGIGFGSETWLAGPEGQNPSQLLVDAENITAFAQYSPEGNLIAFIRFPDNQDQTPPGELWVMDSNGLNARRLATADAGRGFSPVWSPDGTMIAFAGRAQAKDPDSLNLSVYDLKREKLTSIPTAPGTQPAWSPNNESISYGSAAPMSGPDDRMIVWLYEISSGQVKKLVNEACCSGWIR